MRILITGGAGFIGRWVARKILLDGHDVVILDNLSNGRIENIREFAGFQATAEFIKGDVKDSGRLKSLFDTNRFDLCLHLAASINVQDSIDCPSETFENDVVGTFNLLEQCRRRNCKMVYMSTCMVYDKAEDGRQTGIDEMHPVKAASPYAGSKVAGESLALSYWYAYHLPVVVVRPFNTYGPFQKTGGEGGVVAIFIKKALEGESLKIYGSGEQTRDLLYVEDCADFIVRAGYSDAANGEILNAGLGSDIDINRLADMVAGGRTDIEHVPHIHPQSEIMRLCSDWQKAKRVLGWEPKVSLDEGLRRTEEWIRSNPGLI